MSLLFPSANYNNLRFSEIYPTADSFVEDVEEFLSNISVGKGLLADKDNPYITLTYYLLKGSFWESPISNQSLDVFKTRLFTIIYQYGPVWAKKLEIQDKLMALTDDEMREGAKMIYNHAFNPDTAPSTDTYDELEFINDQNVTRNKKTKIDAYLSLWTALSTDLSKNYLNRFKPLFQRFVSTEYKPSFRYTNDYIMDDDGLVVVWAYDKTTPAAQWFGTWEEA